MKLTPEHIESRIATERYAQVGVKTTMAVVTLKNGFEIITHAACVDPADYNTEVGNRIARSRALDKIWELEGYLLQDNMQPHKLSAQNDLTALQTENRDLRDSKRELENKVGFLEQQLAVERDNRLA